MTWGDAIHHPSVEWGSHVQLAHIFDNAIEYVRECRKCESVEHANPYLSYMVIFTCIVSRTDR